MISCSSSNGKPPNGSIEDGSKSAEKLIKEKRRAELSARIASGAYTVYQSRFSFPFVILFSAVKFVLSSVRHWHRGCAFVVILEDEYFKI